MKTHDAADHLNNRADAFIGRDMMTHRKARSTLIDPDGRDGTERHRYLIDRATLPSLLVEEHGGSIIGLRQSA